MLSSFSLHLDGASLASLQEERLHDLRDLGESATSARSFAKGCLEGFLEIFDSVTVSESTCQVLHPRPRVKLENWWNPPLQVP